MTTKEDTSVINDEEYYSVERILGKRIRKGIVYYLIKWEGYDESQSTWEPMENCECAISSILEYEEEQSVKSCSEDQIEVVGAEPGAKGNIDVFVKTKVSDRVFKFNSKEVADRWINSYLDFLEEYVKFKRSR